MNFEFEYDICGEFKKYIQDRQAESKKYEDWSEDKLMEKLEKVKKYCFILETENELLEKYLKNHDPLSFRDHILKLKDKKLYEEEKVCLWESLSYSEELIENDNKLSICDASNGLSLEFLKELMKEELTEVHQERKKNRKQFKTEMRKLSSELKCYNHQERTLIEKNGILNEIFPSIPKMNINLNETKCMDFINFVDNCIKSTNIEIRREDIVYHKFEKNLKMLIHNYYLRGPLRPVDVELVDMENRNLQQEISDLDKTFLELKDLIDNYKQKSRKELRNYMLFIREIEEINKNKNNEKRKEIIQKYFYEVYQKNRKISSTLRCRPNQLINPKQVQKLKLKLEIYKAAEEEKYTEE